MESASNTLPDQPINGVTAGVDWARDDMPWRSSMTAAARSTGAPWSTASPGCVICSDAGRTGREVAIERPDGPVIETLLEPGSPWW